MGRYLGPKNKINRRLGFKVFENKKTGPASDTPKKGGRGASDFGSQLLEKQRVRISYRLSEKQFRNYINEAVKHGQRQTQVLFSLLESRLDSIAFQAGFAHTKSLARQMVSHGHLTVNGRKVTIPSYQVKSGDIIGIREGSKNKVLFAEIKDKLASAQLPGWVSFNVDKLEAKLNETPTPRQELPFDLQAVIEFYSR